MNSSSHYPDWLEEVVEETGNELLYEAYDILDSVLPDKERIRITELKNIFEGLTDINIKRAGFFLTDEFEKEEMIRILMERSNYWRWG